MHEQAVDLAVDSKRQPCLSGLHLHGKDAARELAPRPEVLSEDACVAQRLDVHVVLSSETKPEQSVHGQT
jgi:hypothetical protein